MIILDGVDSTSDNTYTAKIRTEGEGVSKRKYGKERDIKMYSFNYNFN